MSGRIWFGPEREPPHYDRPTIFVEGRPPMTAFLDALNGHPGAAVYFGAGRVDDHDPEFLSLALADGRPVVLEVRTDAHASSVVPAVRQQVDLVYAIGAHGWRSCAFKDDTLWDAEPASITYLAKHARVEVTDPGRVRFACDVQLYPKEKA